MRFCLIQTLVDPVMIKVMASRIRFGNKYKLRETLKRFQILNYYRNILVAAGKPSWYSKNSDYKDNPQARVVGVLNGMLITKLQRLNVFGEFIGVVPIVFLKI